MNIKDGCIILVAGHPGTGKSPWAKKLIALFRNKVIYDRRREYDPKKYTVFYDLKAFRKFILGLEDCAIIAEEATGYVKLYKDEDLTDIIIGIEHNRNLFILLFHSIMDIPKSLLRNGCNYVVVFPTTDTLEEIERNRPKLLPAFKADKPKDKNGWIIPVIVDYRKQQFIQEKP